MKFLRLLASIPAGLLVLCVRGYQKWISPFFGRTCRFHPTCSQYCVLAIQKYGAIIGVGKTLKRISRCHPWHPGGIDHP